MTRPDGPGPRGRLEVYALSVVLLLGSSVAFAWAARTFLDSVWLLWISIGLSLLALLAAVAAVRLPSRHRDEEAQA